MRRTARILVLTTAIATCTTVLAPAAPASLADEVLGTWAGVLHQNGQEQGSVSFTIRRPGSSSLQGSVRYTGLGGCSGKWVFLGRVGDALRFRERIMRGATATCRGIGTVTLHVRSRRELAYRWTDGVIVSRAVVARVR